MRAELERELGDPDSLRAQVLARYTQLGRVRRAHRAFDPHAEQHSVGAIRVSLQSCVLRQISANACCVYTMSQTKLCR